jgi:hypothetical protein
VCKRGGQSAKSATATRRTTPRRGTGSRGSGMAARQGMLDDPSHREDEDEGSLDEREVGDKTGKKRTKTAATKGPWSKEEDDVVIKLVGQYGPKRWSLIASNLPGRESSQLLAQPRPCVRACMVCERYGLARRPAGPHASHLAAGTGKQCRERWHNQLDPNIKKEGWSEEEDRTLLMAHHELGNHWVEISKVFPPLH